MSEPTYLSQWVMQEDSCKGFLPMHQFPKFPVDKCSFCAFMHVSMWSIHSISNLYPFYPFLCTLRILFDFNRTSFSI